MVCGFKKKSDSALSISALLFICLGNVDGPRGLG